jgi:lysosomal alpha-glucosidase
LPGATCDNLNNAEKVDCHPEAWNGKDLFSVKETCHKRGCCWREATGETFPGFQVATPWCFFPSDYENYEIRDFHETHDKLTIALQKTSGTPSFGLSNDSIHIELQVTSVSDDLVRVRVTDIEHRRFVVPAPALNDHSHELSSKKLYKVSFDSFTGRLEILRSSSLKSVFSVNVKQIIFSDQFIQITNEDIPSSVLYGLGENMDDFRKDFSKSFKKIMMYNSDHAPAKNLPLYGTHPFYLMKEKPDEGSPERATKAHGVLFFNNNIQEMTLSPRPSITYRTTGGILDFFIFMGPTNNDVIAQKTKLLGKTDMIPLWSLGFQLCRWGYKNTREITDVYERTVKAGIPLDVKWVDIDYMSKRNDFVIDQQNFTELPAFAKKVRESGRKFIPILDPAVSAAEPKGTYPPYDEGIEMDIFVKNEDGSNFIGQVWNWETSIFPDFSHPRATEYWTRQLKRFSDELEFDGIWIDMNEPANFFDGQKEGLCTRNRWNNPPFMPGLDNNQYATRKTMCPSAKQFLGSHYDLHNMYAFYEAKATHSALKSIFPSKRPYIVSRATVTGQLFNLSKIDISTRILANALSFS